ncbi:unnamed protein product [Cuscuta campestris]|uniref:Integrase catalytic domain-containing protein n=1 Tax=Cuscuta campestris TaxID=132261 RepID=A0A484LU02_9ASTE|nr:unnamed protein product [Cuscuta campestris]
METQLKNTENRFAGIDERINAQDLKLDQIMMILKKMETHPGKEKEGNMTSVGDRIQSNGRSLNFNPKLEFPRFDGSNTRNWIKKAGKYFNLCKIPEDQWVDIASLYMIDKAENWMSSYLSFRKFVSWHEFIIDLSARFRDDKGHNVVEQFKKLEQKESLEDYIDEFEDLRSVLVQNNHYLPDSYILDCFIGGLKASIRLYVRAFKPSSIAQDIEYARLKEESLEVEYSKYSKLNKPPAHNSAKPPLLPTPQTKPANFQPNKGFRTRRNPAASAQSTVRSDNPEQGMIVPFNGLETALNNVANMMANIMERLDKALLGPSSTRDIPAGQPRQVLRTMSSPILQELHDPEEVERERQAIDRRRAEELARNNKVNEGRAKDASRIVGDGNENPRGSVFERISRQKAHVSERLGKNLEKAPQGWIRPQACQVASSNREPRQQNGRGGSQLLVRSLRNLEEDEVQSQARVPAPRRLGPPVPEAGEFQDLRQQIQEMQRKINKGRVFTTHPQEHINSYVQVMIAVDASDALMCRCFLQTVDSKVADWVNHIPAGSIRTWDELGLQFLEHFAGNYRPKKHFTHLASVRQKHGESLKNFLIRWRKESREVEGTNDKSRLAMFTAALQDGLLHTDLTTHPPDTFEEAMVRAGRYVTLEERKEEKKEKTPKEEEKTGNKKPFKNKKQGFPDGPKGASPGTSEKHKSANLVFALPVAEVMAHAAQQGLMTYPTYSQKVCNVEDTGKWCAYHRKNDHNTEDCYTLKNEMARLIRRGHLKKFVQDGDAGNPGNAQNRKRRDKEVAQAEAREKRHIGLEDEEEDSEPALHRQKRHHGCNFIIGGNTGGDLATSRKKWANAAMVNKVLVPEDCAISTVIVREEHGAQHPVYYISKTLRDAELRYSRPEKAMLAVFWTTKRLTPYFQAHRIVVLTNEPLASLTRSPAASARMTKWAVFISQYNVEFRPRPSIEGHALSDFQVECTAREMTRAQVETRVEKDWWVMSIDGSSGSRSCGAGEFEAKEERMKRYRDLSLEMLGRFEFKLEHIPRAQNAEADVLSKLSAESPEYISKLATVEELVTPSLNSNEVIWVSADPPEWLDRLAKYIEDGEAPEDPQEARLAAEAKALMEEIHEGLCAAHQGPYSISRRAIIQGYFWPTMRKDSEEYVRKCATCQQFQNIPGRPATNYTPISSVIPFSRWGVDIVGALPKGAGQARWIVVAIDYFTQWVEAEPLAGITGRQMIDFVGTNILCRFGVPRQIISDNGTQFEEAEFQDFLKTLGIQHTKVSVAYPQANGQVENVNRAIIDGIKKKLLSEGSKWVDELPRILWTYKTTPRRARGDTPFGLAYGFEARAPAEVVIPTSREMEHDPEVNEQNQAVELNFVEERRDEARIRAENYRRQVRSYFDSKVKPRAFQVGD